MKKRIKEIALYVLCTLFLIPMVALAESGGEGIGTIYYVATNGNDSNPGTEAQPWLTIQKAANTMTAGNTVYIKKGVYNEQVIPHNSGNSGNYITYTAYPGDTVTINGDGISLPSYFGGLFDVSDKSYIKISGLKIINAGPNQYNAGIMVYNSSYIIVERNHTYNTVSSGIGVLESSNIIIDDNEVELACNDGTQECITISMTDTFEVRNNHVHHGGPGTNGGEGIDVKNGSSNGKVYNNFVHHVSSIGIYVDAWDKHTYDIEVFKNIVSDCVDGIDVASEEGGLLEDIRIYNNIVHNNKLVGITIAGWGSVSEHPTRDIEIINNTVCNNGCDVWGGGIWVYNKDARNIIIRNNICSQNLSFQIVVDSNIPVQDLNLIVDYNLIDGYRGYGGEMYGSDYVEKNPMFANLSQTDFHLQENSAAIDSGSPFDAPEDDFDGNHRPEGIDHDMGAYEFVFNVLGNIPPTADAGPDVTVDQGEEVPLDGSGSSDPDDGIVAYFWEQTGGPEVDILDPTDVQTSFIAPDLTSSEGVSLTFELTVQDSGGLTAKDTCVVVVASQPSVPGLATLLTPSGTIDETAPAFTWNAVEGATWYRLYVQEGSSGSVHDQWYTSDSVTSGSTCSVTPTTTLNSGGHTWWVQTYNSYGYGAWSSALQFSVASQPSVPGTATLLSPYRRIRDKTPTYTWNTVEGATWYQLYVKGRSGKVIKQWYDADTITSGDTCSVTPDVTLARGKYRWKIRAWNDNGYGDWSNKLRFKVTR